MGCGAYSAMTTWDGITRQRAEIVNDPVGGVPSNAQGIDQDPSGLAGAALPTTEPTPNLICTAA